MLVLHDDGGADGNPAIEAEAVDVSRHPGPTRLDLEELGCDLDPSKRRFEKLYGCLRLLRFGMTGLVPRSSSSSRNSALS